MFIEIPKPEYSEAEKRVLSGDLPAMNKLLDVIRERVRIQVEAKALNLGQLSFRETIYC